MNAATLIKIVNECRAEHWQNSDLMRETERMLEIIADHFSGCEECSDNFDNMCYESETLLDFLGEIHFEITGLMDWIHELPPFDFRMEWDDLTADEQKAWAKKCAEITEKALEKIAKDHGISVSEIKDTVFLDPEIEWATADDDVSDEDWIVATILEFEEELIADMEKGEE